MLLHCATEYRVLFFGFYNILEFVFCSRVHPPSGPPHMHYRGRGDATGETDASDAAPARSLEWGGVLRGARASCSHAGAAVGGDVDKKRHRLSRKVATLPYTNNRTEQTTTVNRDYGRPKILGLHDPTQDTLKGTLSSLWGSSGARCSSAASSQTCPCRTSRQARRPCPLRQHGGAGTGRTVANPLACPCSPASR